MSKMTRAQQFVLDTCLAYYPYGASYAEVLEMLEDDELNEAAGGGYNVRAWEPFEDMDVVCVMEDMRESVEQLLREERRECGI
jgi:hypothetical protein